MLAIGAGLLGLILGPLLGILVDRLYYRETPEFLHRCSVCRSSLSPGSLVPVVGWRARCLSDPSHSGLRYPLIDIGLATSFATLALTIERSWQLAPYLAAFFVLVGLAEFDSETHLLPDRVVKPMIAVVLSLILILSSPNGGNHLIFPALLGSALFGFGFGLLNWAKPEGLGLGDVKLAFVLGALLGWLSPSLTDSVKMVMYTVLLSTVVVSAIGIPVKYLLRRDLSRPLPDWISNDPDNEVTDEEFRGELPMGPFLIMATLVMVAIGPKFLN